MLEGAFNRKLKHALEQHPALKSAWIVKHADSVTGGIPDLSVTIGSRTLWFEVKMRGNRLSALQRWTIDRIGETGAAVVVAEKNGKHAEITGESEILLFEELVEEIVTRCVTVRNTP